MPVENVAAQFAQPVRSVADYQNALAQSQMAQAQLAQVPLHNALLQMQVQGAQMTAAQKQQMFDLVRRITSGGGGNALAPSGSGNALASPGASPSTGMPGGLSFGDIVGLKALGGPDLTADFKLGLEGVSHAPGSEVTDVNGNRRRIAQLATGQTQDPTTGTVSNLPGAVSSAAEAAGATKGAEMRATNQNTLAPADRINPTTGQPYNMTVDQLVNAAGGQQAPAAPPQNQAGALTGLLAQWGKTDPNDDNAISGLYAQAVKAGLMKPEDAQRSAQAAPPTGTPERAAWFAQQLRQGQQIANQGISTNVRDPGFQAALMDPSAKFDPGVKERLMKAAGITAPLSLPAAQPFAGFQGPAEAAAAKARAEAGVKLETAPKLGYAEATAKNAADYAGALDNSVATGQDLMTRINEQRKALAQFTPGMGAQTRMDVARFAKAMGASPDLVSRINAGDIGAKQEFDKLAAQTAMESLKQALSSGSGTASGRITQAEFKVFQKANPNIELEPDAINRIFDFMTKQYQRTLSEQQGFQAHMHNGGDPTTWRSQWARQQDPNASGDVGGTAPKAAAPGFDMNAVAAELRRRGVK